MLPLNLPNVLTLLRILAVPVIVVALLGETPNGDALAAGVFALAALTDGLDGYIARRRQDVTTFGKLMDPLADKLLIIAALVSLVSLGRLAAWVAMVIIARELAVTGLRAVAAEQGVVISASWLGKLKTALQVAAVFALIIWNPSPTSVDVLVYVAVAVTVISGADYFFGLRRRLAMERERRTERGGARRARLAAAQDEQGASSHSRSVMWCGECSPLESSVRISASRPERSANTEWRWIVSRFSWRASTNPPARSCGYSSATRRTISRTQSSTKRGWRWAFSITAASSERFISS